MKNLILVALFLPLVIVINAREEEYQFGDMIAFPRTKKCPCKDFTFKHYVIYVGKKKIDGKNENQDIFHRAGPSRTESTCIFGRLSEEQGTPELDNYLDGRLPVGDNETILKRIEEKRINCEVYNLLTDNCEHLATYVRYGKKYSEQRGTNAGGILKCLKKINSDLENIPCTDLCSSWSKSKTG